MATPNQNNTSDDLSTKVTKVVKLGSNTLLVIDLGPDSTVPEGEYSIKSIAISPPTSDGVGDFCIVKFLG